MERQTSMHFVFAPRRSFAYQYCSVGFDAKSPKRSFKMGVLPQLQHYCEFTRVWWLWRRCTDMECGSRYAAAPYPQVTIQWFSRKVYENSPRTPGLRYSSPLQPWCYFDCFLRAWWIDVRSSSAWSSPFHSSLPVESGTRSTDNAWKHLQKDMTPSGMSS